MTPKMYRFVLLAFVWPLSLALADTLEVPEVPTKAQASSIISAEMQAKAAAAAARKAVTVAVPATEEWELDHGDRKTILRRVAPPANAVAALSAAKEKSEQNSPEAVPWTEAQIAAWLAEQPEHRMLNLSATVYDRSFTRITWRDEDRREWTVLSNIDFRYLGGISHLEDARYRWMTFIFIEEVDSTQEQAMVHQAAEMGLIYEARTGDSWLSLAPADFLSSKAAEYFVLADPEAKVPPALYEELDALHRHYHANEAYLIASYERNKALNAARRTWHQANPREPEDSVVNFWKIK